MRRVQARAKELDFWANALGVVAAERKLPESLRGVRGRKSAKRHFQRWIIQATNRDKGNGKGGDIESGAGL